MLNIKEYINTNTNNNNKNKKNIFKNGEKYIKAQFAYMYKIHSNSPVC